jgi:hypothetical protein
VAESRVLREDQARTREAILSREEEKEEEERQRREQGSGRPLWGKTAALEVHQRRAEEDESIGRIGDERIEPWKIRAGLDGQGGRGTSGEEEGEGMGTKG